MKKYRLVKQEGNEIELLGETFLEVDPQKLIMIKSDEHITHEQLTAFHNEYKKQTGEKVMVVALLKDTEVSKLILEEIEG